MLNTDVLIVGPLDVDGKSFAPIGLHKTDAASDWLVIKRPSIVTKACRDSSYKINRIISVILACTGKKIATKKFVNIFEFYLVRQSL